MKIAILAPIAWRTPPRHYGPWESVASNITEGLVARGHDVTLYATGDSITAGTLKSVCPQGYEEDSDMIPKVWEALHISALFEEAGQYDIIHNHFDYLPLTYSGMTSTPIVSTIHGFSSPKILPVYRKYNRKVHYVSISDADRSPDLDYVDTVYHGINMDDFDFQPDPEDYLLFFGRIHNEKGPREAIKIAKATGRRLIMAGIIQNQAYYKAYIEPALESDQIEYVGSVGPEERNKLLGNARAMLHPIRFDEPFGLSVIESMACGTPVIAFNRGSMPELINHRENGFLADNIDGAIKAERKINQIRRFDCRTYVERYFKIDHMVKNYEQVYENVLSKRQAQKQPIR